MEVVLAEIAATIDQLRGADDPRCAAIADALVNALALQTESTHAVLAALGEDAGAALGASYDYMMQTGYLFGGWQLARAALVAQRRIDEGSDRDFYPRKLATAAYYAEQILPRCAGHSLAVTRAGGELLSYPVDWI